MAPTLPNDARPYPPLALAGAVWGLGAALYLIGFYHRVAPAVLTRELATEFALTAAALGNLSAVYFYSYVAMQIPTGLLADHWGARRTLTLGGIVAAAGALLFAAAESLTLVALGRLLVGAAVGVAFVSMLKLSTHWFHPSRFAAITGMAVATGVVGAVSAGAPLRFAADAFGWRTVMVASAALTAVVALATWLAGGLIIDLMTTNAEIRVVAREYLIWCALAPVAGFLAFQCDGIYIGATRTVDMRNMMILSLAIYLAAAWLLTPAFGNHGLWAALTIFFIVRGVTLGLRLPALIRAISPEAVKFS
jgi:Na+-driven multidrug efflux pump